MRAEMELGHHDRRGGEEGNPPHDIIKRGENGKGADHRVWGFHNKVSCEVLITPLITLFVKKQLGHQVATLSKNVPAVSNVQ